MFSKLLSIVNKSSYEKEELKLHQSLLGVKGGGAKTALWTALSPTFSCNAKNTLIYLGYLLAKFLLKVRQTQQILFENVHKYCPFLF